MLNTLTLPYSTVTSTGPYADTIQAMYDQFVFYPLQEFHAIKVNMLYLPWWNPYLKIDPSKGSLIAPTQVLDGSGGGWMSLILGKLSPRTYEYYYHYSFPVIVEIRKYDDRTQKQNLFRFALESNIRANRCFTPGTTIVTTSGTGVSLLCDEEFRGDTEYTATVKDELTNQDLADVDVYFIAGESCHLGKTDSAGKLKTTLPIAVGGFLNFKKEGYLDYFLHERDFSMMQDVKLKPILQKKIDVKIFDETSLLNMIPLNIPAALNLRDSVLYDPDQTHTMIMTMFRVKDTYHDGILENTVAVEYKDGKVVFSPEEIDLTKGK